MNLSQHFTLAELTRSETAIREGIPNEPGPEVVEALHALCTAVLDPLRNAIGSAIKVNSGYRSPLLNRRIGGAANSQHVTGQAADVQAPGLPVLEVFKRVIQLGLPYDQVIYEAQSATVQWVHVSHTRSVNRGEIRVAQFGANGKPTAYPLVTKEQALAMAVRVTRSRDAAAASSYVERGDEPEWGALAAADAAPKPRVAGKASASPLVTKKPARTVAKKAEKTPVKLLAKVAVKKAVKKAAK